MRQQRASINAVLNISFEERRNTDSFSIETEEKVKAYGANKMRMAAEDYFAYPDYRQITSILKRIDADQIDGVEPEDWYTFDTGADEESDDPVINE